MEELQETEINHLQNHTAEAGTRVPASAFFCSDLYLQYSPVKISPINFTFIKLNFLNISIIYINFVMV